VLAVEAPPAAATVLVVEAGVGCALLVVEVEALVE
jgi:hypothetical protein